MAELRGIAALLICAFLVSVVAALDTFRALSAGKISLVNPLEAAQLGFVYTLVFGIAPVVVYGVPVYLVLRYKALTKWSVVLLVGMAPGLLAQFFLLPGDNLEWWITISGAVVAIAMHLFYYHEQANRGQI